MIPLRPKAGARDPESEWGWWSPVRRGGEPGSA